MAFTCGFFNSQNGDRKYNAEQMASIFDGLIKDGVYDTVGDIFAVTPGTGMQVLVGSGRAWFDHTWNNNDAQYPLAITAADVSLPRYDAVVLETNHSDTVRTNRLRVLTGTPASNPVKPTMASTDNVKQHPLAYIKVTAGATAITQSMIQVVVGTSECPFVTGIIDTAQIDALFQQWNGEFNEWFENLKAQLSDNVVANLQNQIDQKVAKADVATAADIDAGTSNTKWVTPKGLKESKPKVYDLTLKASGMIETIKNSGCIYPEFNTKNLRSEFKGNIFPISALKNDRYLVGINVVSPTGTPSMPYEICFCIVNQYGDILRRLYCGKNSANGNYSSYLDNYLVGEYSGGMVSVQYSVSDNPAEVIMGIYYEKRDLLAYVETRTNNDYMLTKFGETDAMCYCIFPYRDSYNSIYYRVYYAQNDAPNQNIATWSSHDLAASRTVDFSNLIGAHGTHLYYTCIDGSNHVMTIYDYDVINDITNSIFSYTLGQNASYQLAVFDYPNAYFIINNNGNQIKSIAFKFDVVTRANNISDAMNSSFITADSANSYVPSFLGKDNTYYYCSSKSGTSRSKYMIRVNKETLATSSVGYDFNLNGLGKSPQIQKDIEYPDYVLSEGVYNSSKCGLYKINLSDIGNPVFYCLPVMPMSNGKLNPIIGYKDTTLNGYVMPYPTYLYAMFSLKNPSIRCFRKETV